MRNRTGDLVCVSVAIAAVIALGACGRNDTDNAEAVADFEERTTAACDAFQAEFGPEVASLAEEYRARGLSESDLQQRSPLALRFERDLTELSPRLDVLIDDLRSIQSPPGEEEAYDAVLDEMEAVLDRFQDDPLLIADPTSTNSIDEIQAKVGLEVCPGN